MIYYFYCIFSFTDEIFIEYFHVFSCDLLCYCGLPLWLKVKKTYLNTGDLGSISEPRKLPGEENGYPLQYSCLEDSMDRKACQATVHRVAEDLDMA